MSWPTSDQWDAFHFLRPDWLWAIPVGMVLILWLSRYKGSYQAWRSVIDNQLLNHLMDSPESDTSRWRRWSLRILALLGWIVACFSMAGPAWEKIKQPVVKKEHALVLVLDLSLSMMAEDQKPSRLVAAKRKLSDILAQRKEGMTGLVVYSGDAHVVSPLTDDVRTIETLIPPLEPKIMPKYGSNFRLAMAKTQELLQSANLSHADILLLTDEVSPKHFKQAMELMGSDQRLSILTFGTEAGAPIPFESGFYKDARGNVIMAKLNGRELTALGASHGVYVRQSTLTDEDFKSLLWLLDTAAEVANPTDPNNSKTDKHKQREFDQWEDRGYWLAVLLLPLALFGFRRGVAFCLLLSCISYSHEAHAWTWKDLWKTKNHQALEAMRDGDLESAAETFEHDQWKGTAQYKNKDYEGALEQFSRDDSAQGAYNRGNALARLQRYEDAIKAYNEALEKNPSLEDATHNRDLVQRILDQQQQNKDDKKGHKNQDGDKSQQEKQDGNKNEKGEKSEQQQGDQQQNDQQQNAQSQDGDQQQENMKEQAAKDAKEQKEAQQKAAKEGEENDKDKGQANMAKQDDKKEADKDDPQQQLTQMQQEESMTPLEKERRQALKQWLRKIPDDPGQLLKNKFNYQSELNRRKDDLVDEESDKAW